MKFTAVFSLFVFCLLSFDSRPPRKIVDVHIHGTGDRAAQLSALKSAGVYKAALSTSWDSQNAYRESKEIDLLYGLMFPCPNGKVPYSLQPCYSDGKEWPTVEWVETQILEGKVDFLGEVLTQYYGISSADSLLFPYYQLAEKYGIPVGIHTGAAGPDHGSPNFKLELGNPADISKIVARFPGLKIWIMHAGDQYHKEAISLMKKHPGVYADISVLCNPYIVPAERFSAIMKDFADANLLDRILFGSDNADIQKSIAAVEALDFLPELQKQQIFSENAEVFFKKKRN